MRAIQSAMQRFLIFANLNVVRQALLRLCRKPKVQTIKPEPTIDVAAESDDTEEKFAAWETDRDEKLHQAETLEQQGLHLLAKAALLYTAIKCDDRGETFIAEELREHVDTIGREPATEVSDDTICDEPTLRLIRENDLPTNCGA